MEFCRELFGEGPTRGMFVTLTGIDNNHLWDFAARFLDEVPTRGIFATPISID